MNIAAQPIVHNTRANVFEAEAAWRLGPDVLERQSGTGGRERFPFADIIELYLRFDPTRFDTARHRCDLRLADGRAASLLSTHFVGVAEFEDRAATYVPLVRALVERVASANPSCRFRAGKRPAAYWAEHLFLLAMVVLLVLVLGVVGGLALSTLVLVKLAVIAAFVPVMISYTRKNWPRRFDPRAIPPELLPAPRSA
jgi:hypothetical protein